MDYTQGVYFSEKLSEKTISTSMLSYNVEFLNLDIELPKCYNLNYQPIDILFAFYEKNSLTNSYIIQVRALIDQEDLVLSISNAYIKKEYRTKNTDQLLNNKIKFKIPWVFIGVDPKRGYKFLFDIEFTGLLSKELKNVNSHNKITVDEISALKDRHTYLYSPEIFTEITLT